MLQRFELSARHTSIDSALNKYVTKKIGGLDKYLPRKFRDNAHAEVILKETNAKDKNNCTCEVNFQLPHQSINIKESSINMYAAIDIAEAKLKLQLKKYKELSASGKSYRHLIGRFSRRAA
jgi:ribosomal subunit interface protein